MKNFKKDLVNIHNFLKEKKPFAFSKYADGEYKILVNEAITNCDNWTFIPDEHRLERKLLMESFQYDHEDYVVGVSCPCCQPKNHVEWMRDTVKTKNLTWANLFVNSNYEYFINEFISIFDKWDKEVFLFANEQGISKKMPFNMKSWQEPFLSHWIGVGEKKAKEVEGALFLFSGGPLGNILCHKLHKMNPNNTYIDIGSTISPWVVGKNRDYHFQGMDFNKQTCIW